MPSETRKVDESGMTKAERKEAKRLRKLQRQQRREQKRKLKEMQEQSNENDVAIVQKKKKRKLSPPSLCNCYTPFMNVESTGKLNGSKSEFPNEPIEIPEPIPSSSEESKEINHSDPLTKMMGNVTIEDLQSIIVKTLQEYPLLSWEIDEHLRGARRSLPDYEIELQSKLKEGIEISKLQRTNRNRIRGKIKWIRTRLIEKADRSKLQNAITKSIQKDTSSESIVKTKFMEQFNVINAAKNEIQENKEQKASAGKSFGILSRWKHDHHSDYGFIRFEKDGVVRGYNTSVIWHLVDRNEMLLPKGKEYLPLLCGQRVEFKAEQRVDGQWTATEVTAPGGGACSIGRCTGKVKRWYAQLGKGMILKSDGTGQLKVFKNDIQCQGFCIGKDVEFDEVEDEILLKKAAYVTAVDEFSNQYAPTQWEGEIGVKQYGTMLSCNLVFISELVV